MKLRSKDIGVPRCATLMKKEHLKEDSNGSSPEAHLDSCPPSKTREKIEEECNELMLGFQRLGEIESKALMDWHYGLVPPLPFTF